MDGKPSMSKKVRQVHRASVKKNHRSGNYMEVGSWRFEENENGDLVIINIDTNKSTIFLKK